jgi:hypothetical protein
MTTNNRAGRFAPSRYYFPLSKLIAFVLLRRKPNDGDGGRYSYTFHSEHGGRVEGPLISIYIAMFTCVFWTALFRFYGAGWTLAVVASAVIGTVFWTMWVCAVGIIAALLGGWGALRVKLHTVAMVGVSALMALFLISRGVAFYSVVAAPWIAWLLLNLLAWPVAFLLRGAMARSEKELTQ